MTAIYVAIPPNRRGVDPLNYIEKRAMTYPSSMAHAEVAVGNDYYWQAYRLMYITSHDMGQQVMWGNPELIMPDTLGVTDSESRHTIVEGTLGWTARYEVLSHEAGHLLCPPGLEVHADREVCAEAVSAVMMWDDGDLAGVGRSIAYLAWFKPSLHILRDDRTEILRAARILEGK